MDPALIGRSLNGTEDLDPGCLQFGGRGRQVIDEKLGDRAGREVQMIGVGRAEDLELGRVFELAPGEARRHFDQRHTEHVPKEGNRFGECFRPHTRPDDAADLHIAIVRAVRHRSG